MSLTSKIDKDKAFKEILLSVEPKKEDYYTLSKNEPFSEQYNLYAPNNLSNPQSDSRLVGTAFDYLARLRIGQFIKSKEMKMIEVSKMGFYKLMKRPEYKKRNLEPSQPYRYWMDQMGAFLDDSSIPISNLYEIAVHLAKLEHIKRRTVKKEEILDVDYLLFEPSPKEIIDDLDNLMTVFEEKFMIPKIIKKKSEVVFNPNFGVGSLLVDGADGDLSIDGTLYDFKTTKESMLSKKDNLQLIGYFLLNELAIETMSDELLGYRHIDIKRIAFYKARYGEIEYYDVSEYLPYRDVRQKIKEIVIHFKDKKISPQSFLNLDSVKKVLEEIRNAEKMDNEKQESKLKDKQLIYVVNNYIIPRKKFDFNEIKTKEELKVVTEGFKKFNQLSEEEIDELFNLIQNGNSGL
ncbi:hypothetical protein [Peribacillus frigoritolerans]|uniref:Uncharacterized protein n=1 Tax=Peribacillus frigoritolerans TaxID=450367 RepID=A0AAJ1VBS8_9BACI|nr:hypothetical protein [Peribacillus frigoritolerans]MDM5283780.1 hypothetical protein [Peribacillus frigoritolerans]